MLIVVQSGKSDDLRALPRLATASALLFHGALRFKRANLPRGLDPVQDRHGQVHEDQIVGCRAGLEDFERFAAVGGCVDPLSLNSGPCAWTVPAAFSVDVVQQVVAEGTIAALAGGLAVVGVRAWLARRRPASAARAARGRAAAAS